MNFTIDKSLEILERTPATVRAMLHHLSTDWIMANEGENTWSPYDIIGHYIHGEKTDWVPRMEIILSDNPDKHFVPFDRFAQYTNSKGKTMEQLLDEFEFLRKENVAILRSKNISKSDLTKTGIHPAFGEITLAQLLSTWVVHDLNHIAQISRVMSKHYAEDVGPWTEYLRILQW